jgi:ketosteroid isomerase-like protein
MKKLFLNALFVGIVTLGFAQPTFTDKTIQDMNQRLIANPLKFLNEEIDPSFILMGAEGQPLGYTIFKGWYATPGFKMNEWSVADLKVQQLGKTAIAMGIKTHNISIHDTVISHLVERFTYLFEFKNDKWMWTYGQHTPLLKPAAEEEAAIKKMLDEEKKASDAGDFKAYKSHWVEAPYISWLYNGLSFKGDAFWKSAEEKFAGRKPTTNITTRSDWSFTIKGIAAFVTFSQKTENVEKKTTYETYEERYVEKVNGEWKMVNMTAVKKAN